VIRINLIPPEILQSRKDEARWKWVWLGGGVLALLLAMFWGVMFLQVVSSTQDVASVQQQASSLQAQTSRFQIFQNKESELVVRKAAVAAATKGRVDWARMLNELGLVLPTDVYLTSFTGIDNAVGGGDSVVTMAGQGVDEPDDSPNNGYKSIAKMLVRLTDMQQIDSVWLTNMSLGEGSTTEAPMITWAVNARITPSSTTTSTSN
jgi:hypothetical protein